MSSYNLIKTLYEQKHSIESIRIACGMSFEKIQRVVRDIEELKTAESKENTMERIGIASRLEEEMFDLIDKEHKSGVKNPKYLADRNQFSSFLVR